GVMPAEGLEGYDVLILLVPKFTGASVPKDGRLAAVCRFGVGYDSVDVPACTAAGIALVITPDGIRRPVAVSIVTFVLALSQKLYIKDKMTREGRWNDRSAHMGMGIVGRTFGQLGIGNIGAEAIRLLKPFEMKLIAHDPYAKPEVAKELGVELVGFEELFQRSDYLSVSVPLSDATYHIVNERALKLMKPSAYLINTSRGPTVDQKALYQALVDGTIAGAGLDVFEVEPVPADEPILTLDNVIVSPHALCWTDQCFAGNGAGDVAAAQAILNGEKPKNVVNREVLQDPRFEAKLAQVKSMLA
ncbi:MAG TPA: NAD(P)-dependent oxidoreductase, partial [Geminicoccus sp.]|uniref:NAD(P)-dependent oxidoreductase n=1 Tax=Geminicoccus sp. TaxID=2024832 RepID=UPI002E331EA5